MRANDSDVDGDSLTVTSVGTPAHGTAVIQGGNVRYTPSPNYNGGDSFTYTISDGHGGTDSASVAMTVTPVNDPPVATNSSATVAQEVPSTILLHATDIDGDALTYPIVSGPSHGTLSGSGAEQTYTSDPGYSGPDSFTFKANDGTADSNVATVSITVTATPAISIGDVSVTEGNSGTVAATFNVTLSTASDRQVTVDYATADGTAHQPGDYQAGSGTVTFAAGQTSRPVTVLVNGDTLDEDNETFLVNLTNAVHGTLGDSQGVGTITDDDALPSVSIGDMSVNEGNSGTVAETFTVSLNTASGRQVTVDYATADGTAQTPSDYQSGNGTVTFAAGQTSRQVTVLVNGDTLNETNETFLVNLSNAVNGTIGDAQAGGDDHQRRRAAGALDQRRGRGRGQQRHGDGHLHGRPDDRQRAAGDRRLGDRRRHRARARRLSVGSRDDAHVQSRPEHEDGDRGRQRRHPRRGQRDLLRQPDEPDQRDDRRRAGRGDDHRRRR